MNYTPGVIDSGPAYTPYTTDGGAIGLADILPPNMAAGPDFSQLLSAGKGLTKIFAPQTYAAATEWLPSLSLDGIFGSGAAALEGGGVAAGSGLSAGAGAASMGALGGAAMAAGYAAPALAIAQFLKSINQSVDTSVLLGYGEGDDLGEFMPMYGRPDHVAAAGDLYDGFIGDRSWYEGGDPLEVGKMPASVGLMSLKRGTPYYSVGGVPYRNPELAISSGRQIARGMMDLPVEHEPLPQIGAASDPRYAQYLRDASLPVYDAPALMPGDWDMWQDRQQGSPLSGQSNTEASQAWAPEPIEQRISEMPDRQQEWFRTALTTSQMFDRTSENSADYGAIVDDLSGVRGEVENLSPSGRSVAGYQWGTY